MLFSFREYPPTGGLCRIILDLNFDQGRFHGTPGQRGAWIRHDPAFGIAPQIMRRELGEPHPFGESLNHVPDDLLAHAVSPDPVGRAYATKEFPGLDARGPRPRI